MSLSVFRIFQIFGIVSSWATKALADGKITLKEAVDLAAQVAEILGVPTEINVPTEMLETPSDEPVEEAIKKGGV